MTSSTGPITSTGRTVTAIITRGDEHIGVVGPFEVASPWWADVEPVVAHLRDALGGNVVVLRLVDVVGGRSPREGHVTYHVEALEPLAMSLAMPLAMSAAHGGFRELAEPAPRRAAWATPDGVRAALAWAAAALPAGSLSAPVETVVEQVKTWNLSGLFRIPTTTGPVWLKLTPPFAAHEPAVRDIIAAADPSLVPSVLAHDAKNQRMLLRHVPGEDCWRVAPDLIRATLARWVAAQAQIARPSAPLDDVVPDRRPEHLVDGLPRLLDGEAGAQLTSAEMASAQALRRRLPGLVAELRSCGLPDTLVHGDFHPGNWRSDGERTVLIDFADAYLGHPAFDGERLREIVAPHRREAIVDAWCEAWTAHVPGCDPARALRLARPLQALSGAILYQMFLDNVETSERRYHELDPPAGIRDAIDALAEWDRAENPRSPAFYLTAGK